MQFAQFLDLVLLTQNICETRGVSVFALYVSRFKRNLQSSFLSNFVKISLSLLCRVCKGIFRFKLPQLMTTVLLL